MLYVAYANEQLGVGPTVHLALSQGQNHKNLCTDQCGLAWCLTSKQVWFNSR